MPTAKIYDFIINEKWITLNQAWQAEADFPGARFYNSWTEWQSMPGPLDTLHIDVL